MLICVSDYGHVYHLTHFLLLPESPIETLRFPGGVVQKHSDDYFFYKTSRRNYAQNLTKAFQVSENIRFACILDESQEEIPEEVIGTRAKTFEEFFDYIKTPVDERKRNHVKQSVFGTIPENPEAFVMILQTIGFIREEPKTPEFVKKRHRKDQCVVCLDEEVGVMLSCGHENMCRECVKQWNKKCPECREDITRIYEI
jgi:hypothetical protein